MSEWPFVARSEEFRVALGALETHSGHNGVILRGEGGVGDAFVAGCGDGHEFGGGAGTSGQPTADVDRGDRVRIGHVDGPATDRGAGAVDRDRRLGTQQPRQPDGQIGRP